MTEMKFIDAHVHANNRSLEDFERLSVLGCEGLVSVAGPEGGFRGPDSVLDHFRRLYRVDKARVERSGLKCFLALGVHPASVPEKDLDRLLAMLPGALMDYQASAMGEVGLERADALEEYVFSSQLTMAAELGLPVIVHTPRGNKAKVTERILRLLSSSPLQPERILLDHVNRDVLSQALEFGGYIGLSIHPAKLSPRSVADIIEKHGSGSFVLNTDMGAHPSYLFGIPAAISAMLELGVSEDQVKEVARDNITAFLGFNR